MDIKKLRSMSDTELRSEEDSVCQQIFTIRFQKSLGNQDGVKNLRPLRLQIAQIKTILRSRDLSGAPGGTLTGEQNPQHKQEKKDRS